MRERKRLRLKSYNYSNTGFYFITICINDRFENPYLFGNIDTTNPFQIKLNHYGKIADKYFRQIPLHYQNVTLVEYIIMPDHIHGIISITDFKQKQKNEKAKFGKLSKIIKSYKNIITNEIKISGLQPFKWQRSYYDHIIRNKDELHRIQRYIIYNPFDLFLKYYFRK